MGGGGKWDGGRCNYDASCDGEIMMNCCYLLQDETLVHCSLSHLDQPDFIFEVEFYGHSHEVSPSPCLCHIDMYKYTYIIKMTHAILNIFICNLVYKIGLKIVFHL